MKILWQTYQMPAKAAIQWGLYLGEKLNEPVPVKETGSAANQHQFEYTITDLEPGKMYFYRVIIGDQMPYSGTFLAAPSEGETKFSFYGYGDTRPEHFGLPTEHNEVLKALWNDMYPHRDQRQTLLVHLGDYVWNGLNEYLWDLQHFNLDNGFMSTAEVFARLPFMGVLGNHEGYDAYTAFKTVMNYENMGELFRKYYPYDYKDEKRFYYSFEYGSALFVVLDTWSYEGAAEKQQEIQTKQQEWLKTTLENTKKPWKIVMLHTPIWDCMKGYPHLRESIGSILKDNNVQLVLQGHRHYYSHVEHDGITYLTLGGGGAPVNEKDNECLTVPFEKICAACYLESGKEIFCAQYKYHFARFDVSADAMEVYVIDKKGAEIEKFSITNRRKK